MAKAKKTTDPKACKHNFPKEKGGRRVKCTKCGTVQPAVKVADLTEYVVRLTVNQPGNRAERVYEEKVQVRKQGQAMGRAWAQLIKRVAGVTYVGHETLDAAGAVVDSVRPVIGDFKDVKKQTAPTDVVPVTATKRSTPVEVLKHHVSGAVERGEATPVVEQRVIAKPGGKKGTDPTTPAPSVAAKPTAVTSAPTTVPVSTTGGGTASSEFSFAAIGAAEEKSRGTAKHLECAALAGTGKTTTIVQGMVDAKGGRPSITPSEQQREIWKLLKEGRNDSVRISSFNTSITNEMKDKVAKAGLENKGVEARGVHSLGLQTVTKTYGYFKAKTWAVQDKVWNALGVSPINGKSDPKLLAQVRAVDELVSLCKQTLSDTDPETLDQLCSRYDVEVESRDVVYDMVPAILQECRTPKGLIHFDDMVWLPVVNGLSIPKADTQVIDEAQDLNRMMQELIYKAGHRIAFVGDENQAIYGFAGADSESMSRMKGRLDGCTTLGLTVTRRCGKAIVEEARKYIPGKGFEAHSSNPEGLVDVANWSWEGKGGTDKKRRDWVKTYGPLVKPGAMVLCRVNAPLVSECFSFLKRGIKAFILGRKIGQGMVKLIERSKAESVAQLTGWLDDWKAGEVAKEQAKRFPSETRLQNFEDQVSCIAAFCEGVSNVGDVIRKIENVFADKQCPRCGKGHDVSARVCDDCPNGVELILPQGIKFSTIHKSKGLEAEQVFYLQPPGVGPREDKMQEWERQQEQNLKYVAVTRAIKEMYYVR